MEVHNDKEDWLEVLRNVSEDLREAESRVDVLRDRKWEIVRTLKESGHDFRATSEGMDIILSSSPSFNWS